MYRRPPVGPASVELPELLTAQAQGLFDELLEQMLHELIAHPQTDDRMRYWARVLRATLHDHLLDLERQAEEIVLPHVTVDVFRQYEHWVDIGLYWSDTLDSRQHLELVR